jgi:hypothetical protein
MTIVRLMGCGLAGLVLCLTAARAEDVLLWELPAGKDVGLENREGWKPGTVGGKFSSGAAVENSKLLVVAQPGKGGAALCMKGQTGVRQELRLVGATDKPGVIRGVSAPKPKGEEKSILVTTDGAEVTLSLEQMKVFVHDSPGSRNGARGKPDGGGRRPGRESPGGMSQGVAKSASDGTLLRWSDEDTGEG